MFVTFGEALYDVFICPPDASGARDLRAVVGGSPLNVALALARLELPVAFLGQLSTDALGQGLIDRMGREGIDTGLIARRPEPTSLSLVSLDAAGVPTYTPYVHGMADTSLRAADLPALPAATKAVLLGSYAMVVAPIAEASRVLAARAGDRFVSLDPNARLNVEPDRARWHRAIAAHLPHVALIKASDEDLRLLWPGADPDMLAADWLRAGVAMVVITAGAAGAVAITRAHRVTAPGVPVTVADTVGAGDTVHAHLVAGLDQAGALSRPALAALSPDTIRAVLARAVRAAAITCTRVGADPPRRADLTG
jgi:fructokinase